MQLSLIIDSFFSDLFLSNRVDDSTIRILWSTVKWIKKFLHEATTLVHCTPKLGLSRFSIIILGDTGLVGAALFIFIVAACQHLIRQRNVIGDIHILKFLSTLIVLAVFDVLGDLLSILFVLLVGWVGSGIDCLPHLDDLEAEAVAPVAMELLHLLSLVVVRHRQLETPLWSVARNGRRSIRLSVRVSDLLLIIQGDLVVPEAVLIQSVVNENRIWVWWARHRRLTLNIAPLEILVTILSRDRWTTTNNMLVECLEFLESLKFISLIHGDVIFVVQMARIFLETLMPSDPWVIKEVVLLNTHEELIGAPVEVRD